MIVRADEEGFVDKDRGIALGWLVSGIWLGRAMTCFNLESLKDLAKTQRFKTGLGIHEISMRIQMIAKSRYCCQSAVDYRPIMQAARLFVHLPVATC